MWKKFAAGATFVTWLVTAAWVVVDPKFDSWVAFGTALATFLAALVPLFGVGKESKLPDAQAPQRTGIRAKEVHMSGSNVIANQTIGIDAERVKMTGSNKIE